MSITIKEILVRTTVERDAVKTEITEEIIQKLKYDILREINNAGTELHKKRKER